MFDSLIEGSGIISSLKRKPKSFVIRPPVVELWVHHCVLDILFYNTAEHHLNGGEKKKEKKKKIRKKRRKKTFFFLKSIIMAHSCKIIVGV